MRTVFLMIFAWLAAAGIAYAQNAVTVTGRVVGLDSAGANVTIRSGTREILIVLPTTVDIRFQKAEGQALTRRALTAGTRVTVEASKSPTGQMTARQVIIIAPDGAIPPSAPPAANEVRLRSGGGTVTGVPVNDRLHPPAFAAVRATKLGHEVGEVRVNGQTVFRFRGVQGTNPHFRAREVVRRLSTPEMANLRSDEIQVGRANGYWVVMARNVPLITADAATARINATSPRILAAQWAANLRQQISS